MTHSHRLRHALWLSAALLAAPAVAQTNHQGHHATPAAATTPATPATPATVEAPAAAQPAAASTAVAPDAAWADAEVRRLDTSAGKLTLKHGDIQNLGMPPMTMVFQVSDRQLLTNIKVGDRVRFKADRINGAYTVLAIEPAP